MTLAYCCRDTAGTSGMTTEVTKPEHGRKAVGITIFMLVSLTAHNVMRELQMRAAQRRRGKNSMRAALWLFENSWRRCGTGGSSGLILSTVLMGCADPYHEPERTVQADYDRIMQGLDKVA